MATESSSSPISPTIKKFLERALPSDHGKHVLALAERHDTDCNREFLTAHMDELVRDHNLGTLGSELPAFMDVFLWAYRDGRLPVPSDKAVTYMRTLFDVTKNQDIKENSSTRCALEMSAIDHHVDVVHYDARNTFLSYMQEEDAIFRALKQTFRRHPGLRERVRDGSVCIEQLTFQFIDDEPAWAGNKNTTFKMINSHVGFCYALMEAEMLKTKYPEYARWMINVEAVSLAAKKAGMDFDATSAAILAHAANPDKNIATYGGAMHVLGWHDDKPPILSPGTFAKQLESMPLSVTVGTVISGAPEKHRFLTMLAEGGDQHGRMVKDNIPFSFPNILALDEDAVIDPEQLDGEQVPGSTAAQVAKLKRDYENAVPAPVVKYGPDYVARMRAAMNEGDVAETLSRLRAR